MSKMVMMNLTLVLTIVNFVLLLALVWVYLQNYREIKAEFSLGLLLFASLFAAQKIVSFYVFLIIMHDFGDETGGALFLLELLQFLAFSVLAWITLR